MVLLIVMFQFIDVSTIDRNARRKIRSHCMKGKNAGRAVSRPSRRKAILERDKDLKDDEEWDIIQSHDSMPMILRVGHEFSAISFSVDLSSDMRSVMNQFCSIVSRIYYPHQYCNPFYPKHGKWLSLMMTDEGQFYTTLTLMAAFSDFYLEEAKPSRPALTYTSRVFQMLTKELSSIQPASDVNVSLVIGLILHAQLRSDIKSWRIHLEGLRQLVEIRGGLAELRNSKTLLYKACLVDIDLALSEGCSTLWSLSDVPFEWPLPEKIVPAAGVKEIHATFHNIAPTLRDIAIDVYTLVSSIKRTSVHGIVSSDTFQEALLILSYRLVTPNPLDSSYQPPLVDYGCHLGMLAFIITLKYRFGRIILHHDLLKARFCHFLHNHSDAPNCSSLILWLSFMGFFTVSDATIKPWLISVIAKQATKISVSSWIELKESLVSFPWMDSVHDEPARTIWNEVRMQMHLLEHDHR